MKDKVPLMIERVKILEYQNNTDGTVTVLICGKEAGTYQTREVARNSVDSGISKGISNLIMKITGKEEEPKI